MGAVSQALLYNHLGLTNCLHLFPFHLLPHPICKHSNIISSLKTKQNNIAPENWTNQTVHTQWLPQYNSQSIQPCRPNQTCKSADCDPSSLIVSQPFLNPKIIAWFRNCTQRSLLKKLRVKKKI